MKKILKILRNQAVDSTDQNLIDTLRREAQKERLKDMQNSEFDDRLISQTSSIQSFQPTKEPTKYFQPKWIYALGCTGIMLLWFLLPSPSKFKLLIPVEREKLEKQMLVLYEIKETKDNFEESLHTFTQTVTQINALNFKKEWVNSFPGYQALLSIVDLREEFFQVSPTDILHIPQNIDFEFLYKREWELIREEIIGLESIESTILN